MRLFEHKRTLRLWETGVAYHLLFLMLLGIFVIMAISQPLGWKPLLVQGFYLLMFFEALLAAAGTRRQLWIGALLFAPTVLSWVLVGEESLFWLVGDSISLHTIGSLSSTLFLFYLVGLTVVRLFRINRVGWPAVSAAASGFLMLGIAWSGLYVYLEHIAPGSFRGLTEGNEGEDLFYFSFVTLTTLGYGDIAPAAHAARMVTVLEAVIGELFLVILIARFVGMVSTPSPDLDADGQRE